MKACDKETAIGVNFIAYAGAELVLPGDALPPDAAFLAEHRKKIFKKV